MFFSKRAFNARSSCSRCSGDKSFLLRLMVRALVASIVVTSRVSYRLHRCAATWVFCPHVFALLSSSRSLHLFRRTVTLDCRRLTRSFPHKPVLAPLFRAHAVMHKKQSCRNEFRVERLGDLVEAVPLCVIRAHHCRAHPGAPPLMMPKLIIGPFDLFIERGLRQLIGGIQLIHDRFGWLGKLLVVEIDCVLVLLIEVLYPAGCVTVRADVLHGSTALLPVVQLEADDWP